MLYSDVGTNHWLDVTLTGTVSEVNGLGARVQDSTSLHFGLGEAEAATRLKVVWAGGHYQMVAGVAADQAIAITEQRGTLTLSRDGDLVTVVASGAVDRLNLPGAIQVHGGQITAGTTQALEAADLLEFGTHRVDLDLVVIGGGSDRFQFHLNPAAQIVVSGDFDVVWL